MKFTTTILTMALALFVLAFMPADDSNDGVDHHDIIGIASETDNLSTLVTAIEEAELVETLKGDGPFTVFAPTNAAFEALPDGTLEDLLKSENRDQLAGILTYHVVAGAVESGDLQDGMMVETVQGKEIKIGVGSGVTLNESANVESADIEASNGVIHIIDAVIMPPEDSDY